MYAFIMGFGGIDISSQINENIHTCIFGCYMHDKITSCIVNVIDQFNASRIAVPALIIKHILDPAIEMADR